VLGRGRAAGHGVLRSAVKPGARKTSRPGCDVVAEPIVVVIIDDVRAARARGLQRPVDRRLGLSVRLMVRRSGGSEIAGLWIGPCNGGSGY
jgi:hypothetical protein